MSRVPILDYAFLAFETDNSPKHVGGLQIFDLPKGAGAGYVGELVERARASEPQPPFDQRLDIPLTGMPQWVHDDLYDPVDYVFHERLPEPNSMDVLLERVAELHAFKLDRTGPLWELYFFEGLAPRRFAVYFKVHHAYMDGISLSSLAMSALGDAPDDDAEIAFWGRSSPDHAETRASISATLFGTATRLGKLALGMPSLIRVGLLHGLRVIGLSGHELPVPFTAPRTAFNSPVTRRRALGVTSLPLPRLHEIATHAGVTINDVVLELCDAAMTQFLDEHHERPDKPLVAQMPISLRRDGVAQGNQITIALLELGAGHEDPVNRLQHIHAHTKSVKKAFRGMPAEAAEAYTVLLQSAAQLGELTGLDQHFAPLGNVVVSNLIGPDAPRYLGAAPLRAVYPVSTIAPGLAINITCYSYNGELHIGVVAGASEIPNIDSLVGYIEAAVPALEKEMGIGPRRRAGRKKAKTGAGKKRSGKKKPARKTAGAASRGKRTTLRSVGDASSGEPGKEN